MQIHLSSQWSWDTYPLLPRSSVKMLPQSPLRTRVPRKPPKSRDRERDRSKFEHVFVTVFRGLGFAICAISHSSTRVLVKGTGFFGGRPRSVTVYALSFTFRATLGSFSLTFTRRPTEPYTGALPSSCLSMPLMRSLLHVLNFCNAQCVSCLLSGKKIAAHACQHQLDIFVTLRIALPNTADAGRMPAIG